MSRLELFIRLKTADLVAGTALDTLRRDLGYGDLIAGVLREDYWAVEVDPEGCFEEFARWLVHGTKAFINPNKHKVSVKLDGKWWQRLSYPEPPVGCFSVGALVSYKEDERAILKRGTLRQTLGLGDRVGEVSCGAFWLFALRAASEGEAAGLLREISQTYSMTRGLLANPHSQGVAYIDLAEGAGFW